MIGLYLNLLKGSLLLHCVFTALDKPVDEFTLYPKSVVPEPFLIVDGANIGLSIKRDTDTHIESMTILNVSSYSIRASGYISRYL